MGGLTRDGVEHSIGMVTNCEGRTGAASVFCFFRIIVMDNSTVEYHTA